MIGLGDHDHALYAEYTLSTIDRIIGAEACVIKEDVIGGHACFQAVVVHYAYLVVLHLAVVAGQKKLRNDTLFIEHDACVQPVAEHGGRFAVSVDRAAQDQSALVAAVLKFSCSSRVDRTVIPRLICDVRSHVIAHEGA